MSTVLKRVFSFVHLVIYELSLERITIAKCHCASAMSLVFFPQTIICHGSISIGILALAISFSIEPLPFIGTTIWILESVSILSYARLDFFCFFLFMVFSTVSSSFSFFILSFFLLFSDKWLTSINRFSFSLFWNRNNKIIGCTNILSNTILMRSFKFFFVITGLSFH